MSVRSLILEGPIVIESCIVGTKARFESCIVGTKVCFEMSLRSLFLEGSLVERWQQVSDRSIASAPAACATNPQKALKSDRQPLRKSF